MAESSSAVKPPRFRFEDLPAELKLIIIKAALPEQRIFHVSSRWKDKYKPKETGADTYGFTFYYRHPPPALLSVCPAMRAAALQCGVFLDSLRGARGAFFVPAIDMLYLDERHAERLLQRWHGGSPDADAGRRPAIRHIGIECRNRHPDEWGWDLLEQSSLERRPSVLWAEMLATMCMRMPVLQSVTYTLPREELFGDTLHLRLHGFTYVRPKLRGPGGWRRVSERRRTARLRTRGPRRNWCRCRREWRCPVNYFRTWSGDRSRV
ncbi:hypothetical protein MY10362_007011 [Beauveria mimosiformis]